METRKIDIMEVILKNDLKIPLTMQEEQLIQTIDEESKEMIRVLFNDDSYKEELIKMCNKIILKLKVSNIKDSDLFIARCMDKISNLENPTSISENIAKIYK